MNKILKRCKRMTSTAICVLMLVSAAICVPAIPLWAEEDTTPPQIKIGWPNDGLVTNADVYLFYRYTLSDDVTLPEDIVVDGDEESPYTENGEYEVTLTAWDEAGNSAQATVSFTIDKLPPVTGFEGYLVYITKDTPITLKARDNASGVASTLYRINEDEEYQEYAPFKIKEEGSYLISYYSIDNVGNVEEAKSQDVWVDNTPPVTSISVGEPRYSTEPVYVTSATEFTLFATDALSGVASTEYKIDDGEWIDYESFTIPTEGAHTISYHSIDNVDNVEVAKNLSIIVDNTPPTTSIAVGTPRSAEYVTSDTEFTLSSIDGGPIPSGVQRIEYRVAGWGWSTYSDPFTITGPDDPYTIEYRGIDNVDNTEGIKSLFVVLDNTPPITTISVGTPQYQASHLWVTSATVFTLPAADPNCGDLPGSGVDRTTYRIDGSPWTEYTPFTIPTEGPHVIDYRSIDKVKNLEPYKSLSVVVDNTPPETTVTIGAPQYIAGDDTWITSTTPISLSVVDKGPIPSGVKEALYQIDGGSWVNYDPSATFTLSGYGEGRHTINYKSTDNVLNAEADSFTVIVDDTPPETTVTIGTPQYIADGYIWVTSATQLSLSVVDKGLIPSGVKEALYQIDGGSWVNYDPSATFTLSGYGEGEHTISYISKDNVLNTEEGSFVVIVDDTPPTTTIAYDYHDGTTVIPESEFTLTAEDFGGPPPSGVQYTKYSIDSEQWLPYYDEPFTIADYAYLYHSQEAETWMLGEHTITYYSVDNVENTEEVQSLSITVSPALEVSKDLAPRALVWLNYSEEELAAINQVALQEALTQAQAHYSHIVTTEIEFIAGLRSNLYSSYVILGAYSYCGVDEYVCLPKKVRDELKEQVCLGKGLITSLLSKFDNVTPTGGGSAAGSEVLGVWFRGDLPEEDYSIEMLPTEENPEGYSFTSTGSALTVGILEPDQAPENKGEVLGYIADDPDLPAAVINAFGRGRTAFFAFDVGKSIGTEEVANLLTEALIRVSPKSTDPPLALVAGGEVAIQITIQALVVDIPGLTSEDILPADAEVISASGDGTIAGNQITWYLDLSISEPTILTYLVRLPSATTYTATTKEEYLVRGNYYTHPPFDDLTLTFQIPDPEDVKEEILSALDVLEASAGGETAWVRQAYDRISTLPDLSLELTPDELYKAILDILAAIQDLDKVTSLDYEEYILPIRHQIDQLMLFYEVRLKGDPMHLSTIDLALQTQKGKKWVLATVTVVDDSNNPVAGAMVSGSWSGATTDTDSGITDLNGKVTLESNKLGNKFVPSGTTYTFTVNGLIKDDGWYYAFGANVETSDFITVP